jgi:hypothetical protein
MDAPLSARGRGQAPKPRSEASKTPGLSATGRKTMRPAVPLLPRVVHQTALATGAGIDTVSVTISAGYGTRACGECQASCRSHCVTDVVYSAPPV